MNQINNYDEFIAVEFEEEKKEAAARVKAMNEICAVDWELSEE